MLELIGTKNNWKKIKSNFLFIDRIKIKTFKMKTEKNAWDFVIEYYPNYSSSNEIAHSDDLEKLKHDDYEDGDDASKLLYREYNGDINNPQIETDLNELLVQIYEKAIENYLTQNVTL